MFRELPPLGTVFESRFTSTRKGCVPTGQPGQLPPALNQKRWNFLNEKRAPQQHAVSQGLRITKTLKAQLALCKHPGPPPSFPYYEVYNYYAPPFPPKGSVIKVCFRTSIPALRCAGQVQAMLASSESATDVKRNRCGRQVDEPLYKKILVCV